MDQPLSVKDILNTDKKVIKNQYSAIQQINYSYEQPTKVWNNSDANFIKTVFQEKVDGLMIGVSLPWNNSDKLNFWTTAAENNVKQVITFCEENDWDYQSYMPGVGRLSGSNTVEFGSYTIQNLVA